ncbi:MAG TPA: MFS transporter [Acidimicrobiales bacterium]|nr:MFS transporter [Acidimicrobiales bacterium]
MSLEPTSSPSAPSTEVSFRSFSFASATGIFILMGAVTSLYGPLLESFTHRFHISLPTAGAALSVYFVGATLGVLPGWLGLKRLNGRHVLTLSLLSISLGAAGATFLHSWAFFLASAFVIGLGFGALDIALNTLLARTAPEGRAHRLSIGNGGYGVGAVICPLVIIGLGPSHFTTLFGGLCVIGLVLSTANGGVHAPPLRTEALQREITKMKAQRRPILFTFVIAYVLYVAIETTSSGWMATDLHGVGYSQSIGSLVTAGFWGGLAVGRLAGGPLYHWLSDKKLVLGGLTAAIVLCGLAAIDPVAPFAYPLLGLIIASIFPMGLIWYTKLCPHDSDGLSLLIFIMMIGGVAGPGLVSLLVSHLGVRVVPFTIAIYAALDLAVFLSARRFRPIVVAGATDPSSST